VTKRRLLMDEVLDELGHNADTQTPQEHFWTCGQCLSSEGVKAYYHRRQLKGKLDFIMTLVCPRCSFNLRSAVSEI
jgi:hypothetical protein